MFRLVSLDLKTVDDGIDVDAHMYKNKMDDTFNINEPAKISSKVQNVLMVLLLYLFKDKNQIAVKRRMFKTFECFRNDIDTTTRDPKKAQQTIFGKASHAYQLALAEMKKVALCKSNVFFLFNLCFRIA